MPRIKEEISEYFYTLNKKSQSIKVAFIMPDLDFVDELIDEIGSETLACAARFNNLPDAHLCFKALELIGNKIDGIDVVLKNIGKSMLGLDKNDIKFATIKIDGLSLNQKKNILAELDKHNDNIQKLIQLSASAAQRMNSICEELKTQKIAISSIQQQLDEIKKMPNPKVDLCGLNKTLLDFHETQLSTTTGFLSRVSQLYNLSADILETQDATLECSAKICEHLNLRLLTDIAEKTSALTQCTLFTQNQPYPIKHEEKKKHCCVIQ